MHSLAYKDPESEKPTRRTVSNISADFLSILNFHPLNSLQVPQGASRSLTACYPLMKNENATENGQDTTRTFLCIRCKSSYREAPLRPKFILRRYMDPYCPNSTLSTHEPCDVFLAFEPEPLQPRLYRPHWPSKHQQHYQGEHSWLLLLCAV